MEKMFKRFLHTSVGFATLAKDKMTKLIEELIAEGRLSKDEGAKIINDYKSHSDEQRQDFDSKMKDVIDKTMENLKFVKQKEVEKLRNRIDILERLISQEKENQSKKETEDKPDDPTEE